MMINMILDIWKVCRWIIILYKLQITFLMFKYVIENNKNFQVIKV